MLQKFISTYASGKWVLVLALIFISFNVFIFPRLIPADKEPLDLQIFYGAEKAYELIAGYPDDVRKNYLLGEMTLDVIYPVVYTLLFSFIIFLLYKNARLAQLPFLILLADLLENTGIILLLYNYPEQLAFVATITGFLTLLKWILVAAVVLTIVFGLAQKLFFKKK